MKVLLALSIILGGVLISKSSYATSNDNIVKANKDVSFAPSTLGFGENAPKCKYLQGSSAQLKGGKLNASNKPPMPQ